MTKLLKVKMMQQSESLVDENPYVQILYKKIRALRKK